MDSNRQKPPIVAILFLIVFLMGVLYFVASQQLKNSKTHRLRLLAGFGARVEATVPDLAQRFVRIAQETEDPEKVEDYVEQIPDLTFLPLSEKREDATAPNGDVPSPSIAESPGETATEARDESVEKTHHYLTVKPLGQDVYLVYRGPGPSCFNEERRLIEPCGELRTVKARLDLEALLAPAVLPDAFDSILLAQADEGGKVLFQEGEPELRLTSLASIQQGIPEADEEPQGFPARLFSAGGRIKIGRAGLSGSPTTGSVPVEVAEVEYRLFFQPVVLELPALQAEESQEPIHWVAGGFVARGRLLSASFTSSPILLFSLLAIFPLGVLAWPFLKLWLVSSRQRLTRLDVGFLVLSTLLGCFLITLMILDVAFWYQMRARVDDQLAGLAEKLEYRFQKELDQATSQLQSLNDNLCQFQELGPAQEKHEGYLCTSYQCGSLELSEYPVLHSAFWVDDRGRQKIKIAFREHSKRKSSVVDRDYFRCAIGEANPYVVPVPPKRETEESVKENEGENKLCLESVISNTGGNDQAILAVPDLSSPKECADSEHAIVGNGKLRPILATRLASLTQAVLPATYGFAVVEANQPRKARVLFHSDTRRILSEDLLKASDEDALLASMLDTRREGSLALRYWGQRHRAHVLPLKGLPWALVTFRTTQDLRMRNLELLYDVANPAVLFFLVLLILLLLGRSGPIFRNALWPDPRKNRIYGWIVVFSVMVLGFICYLFGVAEQDAPERHNQVFLAALVLPLIAIGAGLGALWFHDRGKDSKRWYASKSGWWEKTIRFFFKPFVWLLDKNLSVIEGLALTAGLALAGTGLKASFGIETLSLFLATFAFWFLRFYYWRDFRLPYQQRGTHILAITILLFLGSVVPAIGLFSLARERQWTFLVQETQEGLVPALEEQQQETFESHGEGRPFFARYESQLEGLRDDLLRRLFYTEVVELRDSKSTEMEASSAKMSSAEAPAPEESRNPGWPWNGFASQLFSSRPVPVNDLSAEPRGVDLSRFHAPGGKWSWISPDFDGEHPKNGGRRRPMVQGNVNGTSGSGSVWRFRSEVPGNQPELKLDRMTSGLIPPFMFVFLCIAWLCSPYLAIRWIADRVLLATLAPVREEKGKGEKEVFDFRSDQLVPRDLADLKQLLDPEYLDRERMLLVLGVPELALQILGEREQEDFSVIPWNQEEAELVWQAEATAGHLVITRFSITLDHDENHVEATSKKLQLLSRWHRDEERAVVLFADMEPREILRATEPDEDPSSSREILRRQWASLLGSFTFHYASDRGKFDRFQSEILRRRTAVIDAWLKEEKQEAKKTERWWDKIRTWFLGQSKAEGIEEKREEIGDLQKKLDRLKREDEKHSNLDAKEAIKRLTKEIDDLVTKNASLLNRKGYQEMLWTIDVLQDECRPTAQLQHIGRQILDEFGPGDYSTFTHDKMVAKIALRARTYYHAIWSATTEDEKVVLAQLAHTGLVSPDNRHRVLDLMYRGLIVRDPKLRLMNDSFALFIRQMVSKSQLLEWEGEEAASVWSILRWLLPVPLLLFGGFVFITQRDAVSSALGFLLAAASVAPTLVNLFGYFEQRFAQRMARERELERAEAQKTQKEGARKDS